MDENESRFTQSSDIHQFSNEIHTSEDEVRMSDFIVNDTNIVRDTEQYRQQTIYKEILVPNANPFEDNEEFIRQKIITDQTKQDELVSNFQRTFTNDKCENRKRYVQCLDDLSEPAYSAFVKWFLNEMRLNYKYILERFHRVSEFETYLNTILGKGTKNKIEGGLAITLERIAIPTDIKAELLWILVELYNTYCTFTIKRTYLKTHYNNLTAEIGNETDNLEQNACGEVKTQLEKHLEALHSFESVNFLVTYVHQFAMEKSKLAKNRASFIDSRMKTTSWTANFYQMFSKINQNPSEENLPEICTTLLIEPLIHEKIGKMFNKNVKISFNPTKGKILEEDHPCYKFRLLKNKPSEQFIDDQFLYMTDAENDGEMEITFGDDIENKILDELESLFKNQVRNANELMWYNVKYFFLPKKVLHRITELCKQELKNVLKCRAENYVIMCCARKLREVISVAPYSVDYQLEDFSNKNGIRVIGISYRPENPIFAEYCLLDENGEVDRRTFRRSETKFFTNIILKDFLNGDPKFPIRMLSFKEYDY